LLPFNVAVGAESVEKFVGIFPKPPLLHVNGMVDMEILCRASAGCFRAFPVGRLQDFEAALLPERVLESVSVARKKPLTAKSHRHRR